MLAAPLGSGCWNRISSASCRRSDKSLNLGRTHCGLQPLPLCARLSVMRLNNGLGLGAVMGQGEEKAQG